VLPAAGRVAAQKDFETTKTQLKKALDAFKRGLRGAARARRLTRPWYSVASADSSFVAGAELAVDGGMISVYKAARNDCKHLTVVPKRWKVLPQ
jgi:hypothetical protein